MTDLRKKRGDAIRLAIGPVLQPGGAPQDLAGLTIRFTAKDRLDDDDADAVIVGSTADGRIAIDAPSTAGKATVTIPGSETASFTSDRTLHWDVQVSDAAGTITVTLDGGLLYVERDVTRTTP